MLVYCISVMYVNQIVHDKNLTNHITFVRSFKRIFILVFTVVQYQLKWQRNLNVILRPIFLRCYKTSQVSLYFRTFAPFARLLKYYVLWVCAKTPNPVSTQLVK